MNQEVERPRNNVVGYVVAGIGILLLVLELPFALAFGLVGSTWATILMTALWVFLFLLAIRWVKRRSYWVLVLPVIGAVVWFGTIYLGETFFGWTA